MSVYRVVDKLETTVKEGLWLPFGARIVNQDRILDLVEKLRSGLPEELSRARALVAERDRLVEQMKTVGATAGTSLAATVGVGASPTATSKTAGDGAAIEPAAAESELLRKAKERADALVTQAEAAAREIRRGADQYADQVLTAMDTSLGNALAAVKKGRQTLAAGLSGNGSPRAAQRRSP